MRLPLIVIAVVVGFFLPALLGGSGAVYSAFVLIAIFAVMSYGLDIIVSDLGEVSLAHTVFFAVGAYTAALLSTGPGFGPILTLIGAWIAALVIAGLLGLATLRLREFVFSLVTYAVAVVATTVAQNWDFLGGSDGLRGIPVFEIALGPLQFKAGSDEALWPVAFLILLVTLYLVRAFRRSRLGLSAMGATFTMGLTLSIASPIASELRGKILPTEGSLLLPALLLAGARLAMPGSQTEILLLATALAARVLSSYVAGAGLAMSRKAWRKSTPWLGLAMTSSGSLTVMVGLAFSLRLSEEIGTLALTCAALGTVLGELAGPFTMLRALDRAGELHGNVEKPGTHTDAAGAVP